MGEEVPKHRRCAVLWMISQNIPNSYPSWAAMFSSFGLKNRPINISTNWVWDCCKYLSQFDFWKRLTVGVLVLKVSISFSIVISSNYRVFKFLIMWFVSSAFAEKLPLILRAVSVELDESDYDVMLSLGLIYEQEPSFFVLTSSLLSLLYKRIYVCISEKLYTV